MSGRLGPDGLLYDYGEPLRKIAMDGAQLATAKTVEVTVDTDEAVRDRERQEIERVIPHLYRL